MQIPVQDDKICLGSRKVGGTGNSDRGIGAAQDGCIVEAIANHEHAGTLCLQGGDMGAFVLW